MGSAAGVTLSVTGSRRRLGCGLEKIIQFEFAFL